ncbi:hypothetical protein [Pseudomonas frederiksbergensis]|uniref:Uncharacterized protein n=1 Tax=Pseudomonas frederiksbergensis TaxID=104087 RepID=A0A423I2Y8_9PSED|nr:hypothetical protein [Pseudomonas frederiksbergensis]RON19817.1 hypothetical protein BK662_00815 [Pseudomonas frederiksbergensis]
MTFSIPVLPRFSPHEPDKAIIKLSNVGDFLIVRVPDPNDIPPNWDVYPILGADTEEPDWEGLAEPTGVWDDASDDMVKRMGIELLIPKAELEKYQNTEIELRYKFADESSLEPCSEPLRLYVEA